MNLEVRVGPDKRPLRVTKVSTDQSLEQAVSGAQLTTFERLPQFLAERVEIDVDRQLRFTGVLEQTDGMPETGYTWTQRSSAVGLRLTDALQTEIFRSTDTAAITEELAVRVGVQVATTQAEPVKRFRLRKGQPFQQALQALAESHGFVVTDDQFGRVVLYRLPERLRPAVVWEYAHEPVLSIREINDIRDWRDEYICRGQAAPEPDQVVDAVLGQIGVGLVAGNIRPSRRVIPNRTARSKAQARQLVANEARKDLARSYALEVELTATDRTPGDLVRIKRPDIGLDLLMVLSSLSWTLSPNETRARAMLRLPDAYGDTGNFSQSAIDAVFV